MANPLTAADGGANAVHEFSTIPQKEVTASLQGDANDFTWEVQQSHDGSSWQPMSDGSNSSFTGCQPMTFEPLSGLSYRVEVTSLGTATSIYLSTN